MRSRRSVRSLPDDGVMWTWTPIPSKRNAVKVGTELASGEILVLVDSDTVWTRDTLCELVKPFADPGIGGVTTRQRVLDPQRHFFTRWADWLENSRVKYSMPAQSVLGHVGCLPGRTIAFRRQFVVKASDEFMHGRFLGVFLEISDDRTLTNLALKQGYRTVYQSTSLVFTDAPVTVRKLYKQPLRWARGSQYNPLRMLPWMVRRAPVLAVFFVSDIVLPFLLLGASSVVSNAPCTAPASTTTPPISGSTGSAWAWARSSCCPCWRPGCRWRSASCATSRKCRATGGGCPRSCCSRRCFSCPSASSGSSGWPTWRPGAPAATPTPGCRTTSSPSSNERPRRPRPTSSIATHPRHPGPPRTPLPSPPP